MTDEKFEFDEDFQKLIAAVALKDPSFLLHYEDVMQPGYFEFDYLSSIVRTAKELVDKFESVPTKPTMFEEIKQFCIKFNLADSDRDHILSKLEELYTIPTVNLNYVIERVVEFGQRQALKAAVLKIVTRFQDPRRGDKKVDVYSEARDLLESALRVGTDSRDFGLSLYPNLLKLPAMAQASPAGIERKIPSGFPTIDKHTTGGFGRGELWAVAGLPGRGKSALFVNIGAHWVRCGLPTVVFTIGDLQQVDYGVRFAAQLTRSTVFQVTTNDIGYQTRATILSKYDPKLYIKYFEPDTIGMGHIRSYLSKLRAVHSVKPAGVFIDYPEEMKLAYKDNLYMSGGANYSAMKKMAGEFEAVFMAASQVKGYNPQHAKDVIRGDNLNESKKKFQKLDGLMTWNYTDEDEIMGRGRIWMDKTRRAKSFYLVHCDVDLACMRIKEGKPPETEYHGPKDE